jgi:membrane fusion protein, multidrug efflux system
MAVLQYFGSHRWIAIIGVLVAVAIVALGVWQLSGRSPPAVGKVEAAVPVTAAVAVRADVPDFIRTIGTVQSIDSIAIESQVSGPIVKIEFNPGQEVKQGQELFLIDPRPYQAALDAQQAQLAHDEAALAEAEVDLKRYETLAKENAIAQQQAQDQSYTVQQDKATVQLDQANVKTAQINLGYCHITAPISGRAGVLLVDLGNLVGPSSATGNQFTSSAGAVTTPTTGSAETPTTGSAGTAAVGGAAPSQTTAGELVSIIQMHPIYVTFPIPETMIDEVRQNQTAGELEVDAYSQSGKLIEKGKLTVIDNQVNTGTGTVSMQGTFANADDALWPGEFVSVALVLSIRRNVVVVPAQAVMAGPSGSYVYVINADGSAQRTDVQVASRQGGTDVIEKGVSPGEKVVTDGQYLLANGIKVDVRKTTEPNLAQR